MQTAVLIRQAEKLLERAAKESEGQSEGGGAEESRVPAGD